MKLHNLENVPGAVHRRKRVGTGIGSGHGRKCGRGQKGQNSRSGSFGYAGFEGGQMPLYRQLPRRGFNNKRFSIDYALVNLADLNRLEGVSEIDRDALIKHGLIRANAERVKLLGNGEINRAVTISVDKVSAAAKSKIEAAGGTVRLPEEKKEEK